MHTYNKKRVYLLFMVLPAFIIGCSGNAAETEDSAETAGYVSSAALSDREENLLMALAGSNYFIYDINVMEETVGWVEYWVTHYRDGTRTGRILATGSKVEKSEEPVRLLITFNFDGDKGKTFWNAALIHGESMTRGNIEADMPLSSPYSMLWEQVERQEIIVNEEIVLGAIVAEEGSSSGVGISSSTLTDEEALNDFIETNQHVYLIKCRFEPPK